MSDAEHEYSPTDELGPWDPRTTLGRPSRPLDPNRAYREFIFEIPDTKAPEPSFVPVEYAVWNVRLGRWGVRVMVGYVLLRRPLTTGQIFGLFRQGVDVMCYELTGEAAEHAVSIEDPRKSLFGINRAKEYYAPGILETGIEVNQRVWVEEQPL